MDNDALVFFLMVAIGVSIWLYVKLRKERKKMAEISFENRKLIADNAMLEAEHLKFQLQPHTLNNILANLRSIARKLNRGMDSLSGSLEYILYKGKTHFVSVEDEVKFIEQYLALNDLFVTEVDSIKLITDQVDTKSKYYHTPCLPHLITAYFIENAFKHGDQKHPEFLKIQIALTDRYFEIIVTNKFNKQATNGPGGLGLVNMKKRLDLLAEGRYETHFQANNTEYQSKLKLLF